MPDDFLGQEISKIAAAHDDWRPDPVKTDLSNDPDSLKSAVHSAYLAFTFQWDKYHEYEEELARERSGKVPGVDGRTPEDKAEQDAKNAKLDKLLANRPQFISEDDIPPGPNEFADGMPVSERALNWRNRQYAERDPFAPPPHQPLGPPPDDGGIGGYEPAVSEFFIDDHAINLRKIILERNAAVQQAKQFRLWYQGSKTPEYMAKAAKLTEIEQKALTERQEFFTQLEVADPAAAQELRDKFYEGDHGMEPGGTRRTNQPEPLDPAPEPEQKPLVESSHYDDGHALGWRKKEEPQADWKHLTSNASTTDVAGIVESIEEPSTGDFQVGTRSPFNLDGDSHGVLEALKGLTPATGAPPAPPKVDPVGDFNRPVNPADELADEFYRPEMKGGGDDPAYILAALASPPAKPAVSASQVTAGFLAMLRNRVAQVVLLAAVLIGAGLGFQFSPAKQNVGTVPGGQLGQRGTAITQQPPATEQFNKSACSVVSAGEASALVGKPLAAQPDAAPGTGCKYLASDSPDVDVTSAYPPNIRQVVLGYTAWGPGFAPSDVKSLYEQNKKQNGSVNPVVDLPGLGESAYGGANDTGVTIYGHGDLVFVYDEVVLRPESIPDVRAINGRVASLLLQKLPSGSQARQQQQPQAQPAIVQTPVQSPSNPVLNALIGALLAGGLVSFGMLGIAYNQARSPAQMAEA
jgi:hypothetical protein